MTDPYRTLIHGVLAQDSALCVGGAANEGPNDTMCARDGAGRLTIPGTSLAGALLETAGRIQPRLFDPEAKSGLYGRLTGKTRQLPGRGQLKPSNLRQSLWIFKPAHVEREVTESRQGVGIRQDTGATAGQKGALFDMETVPVGTRWEFTLEIDTHRGGAEAEDVALAALREWANGRCWLGASAARGMGWMALREVEILRLPMTLKAIEAWPDNRLPDTWADVKTHLECHIGDDLQVLADDALQGVSTATGPSDEDRFWYLTVDATLSTGRYEPEGEGSCYGLDAISVGGHAAHTLWPLSEQLLGPLGLREHRRREEAHTQHAPVVATQPAGDDSPAQPFVPGSGIRGPLRHATSRWLRADGVDIADPNRPESVPSVDKPDESDESAACQATDGTGESDKGSDPVATLFGIEKRSGRLLIRDAALAGLAEGPGFTLAILQHHAEDEFAGGAYQSSKFDRTAVVSGSFDIRLVVEAASPSDLRSYVQTLKPALRLAELGHLPMGASKWRGLGWCRWAFERAWVTRAGDPPPDPVHGEPDVVALLAKALAPDDSRGPDRREVGNES